MAPPLLSLRDGHVTFGGRPLFTGVTLHVGPGEKCCLVGRNGSGKSTLLKILAGTVPLDEGERFIKPGARLALLGQDPALDGPSLGAWIAEGLPTGERDQTHRVEALAAALAIDPSRAPQGLSGGEARRAALARALVGDPDILLLDEPTNHLDLPTILWLEERLAAFQGALVTISHDRAFLARISRQTLWLDRGVVRRSEKGFAAFEAWQDAVYEAEAAEEERLDKRLEAEGRWLARGVTARRKRNMGRLRALKTLRKERAERIGVQGSVKLAADAGQMSGRLVIEAEGIAKGYDGRLVVKDFSTRIMRGDRVGLIGPNGAGKTTLLRLLTGDLAPDAGTVRLGTNLEAAYFDQKRERLDPDATVWDTLTDGAGDSVNVRGTPRHVVSYMRDFLFEDRQAKSPVRSLSGGERNRLLLARLLARSSNLLILDEPTNDLDMDTLDLLEEMLADYQGTLLVVSHDRDFLDRLVTSVIAVEGGGRIQEYVGGYTDALAQGAFRSPERPGAPAKPEAPKEPRQRTAAARLSYKDQRELDELPGLIERLQAELAALESRLADPGLYARDRQAFEQGSARLAAAGGELAAAEERWLELEMRKDSLAAGSGGSP